MLLQNLSDTIAADDKTPVHLDYRAIHHLDVGVSIQPGNTSCVELGCKEGRDYASSSYADATRKPPWTYQLD
jgi:hypothetical protein